MPSVAPASAPNAPRSRDFYTRHLTALRPHYTHGRPSGASHSSSLLLPCRSSATVLSPKSAPRSLTPHNELSDSDDQTAAVAQSPDGSIAALALRSGRVDLIDVPTGSVLRSLRPFRDAAVVSFLNFDASGAFVALAAADGHVRVYDVRAGHVTHVFRTEGGLLTAMEWHPDPKEMALLLGMESGAVMLCDLSRKKAAPRELARKHVGSVVGFAFADEGCMVVSAGADKLLYFARWGEMEQGRIVASGERLVGVLAPGGRKSKVVLSVGEQGVIRSWDVDSAREAVADAMRLPFTTGKEGEDEEEEDEDERETPLLPVAMTRCGPGELVVAMSDQTLLYVPMVPEDVLSPVRDVVCGNLEEIYDIRSLRTRDVAAKVANRGMKDFAVASNSSCLWIMRMTPSATEAAPGPRKLVDGNVAHLDGKSAEDQATWSCHAGLQGHSGIILCVDALTNPKAVGKANVADAYLVTSSRDKSARVWWRSRVSGKWTCLALAEGHTDAVGAVAISPRTTAGQFFIVTGAADRTIKLWSLDQAQKAAEKAARSQAEAGLLSSAEEQTWSARMDTGENSDVAMLSAKWTMLAHEKDVNAVAISPDAQIVATGSQDRSLKMWDVAKGTLQFTCAGHKRGIWNVTFSTVDRIVASCSGDATVRIWSVANGNCLRTFQGHLSGVLRSVFISGGTQLASAGADGLIKIWITKTGECASTLDAHEDRAWALDSMDEGDVLVTGGADGLVQLWRDTSEEQALAAVEKKEEEALMEQAVHNAARAGRWSVAARGALKIGMTRKLRSVLMDLIQNAENAEEDLMKMVCELSEASAKDGSKDELGPWALISRLFLCCRDWNASGGVKNAAIASRVLKALFSVFTPEVLCESLVSVDKRALVEALDAHCTRHLDRVSGLTAKVAVLEHTLEKMRGLAEIDDMAVDKEVTKKAKMSSVSAAALGKEKQGKGVKRKRKNREDVAADY